MVTLSRKNVMLVSKSTVDLRSRRRLHSDAGNVFYKQPDQNTPIKHKKYLIIMMTMTLTVMLVVELWSSSSNSSSSARSALICSALLSFNLPEIRKVGAYYNHITVQVVELRFFQTGVFSTSVASQ